MAVELSISNRAPMLPIDLSEDFMFALRKFCNVYGNKPMTQPALKILQSIPLVHSALAVKESEKMSAAQRYRAASKCMQEIVVPGFIKLIEHAMDTMDGPLPMPHKWKEMVYYTTLGSGSSKAKTFMEKQTTVLTKFKAHKAEYTKVWLWLDTNDKNTPSELPSGTNTQDSLEKLNDAMWFASDQYKREKAKEKKEQVEFEIFLTPEAAGISPAGSPAGSPAAGSPPAGQGPAAQAALAETGILEEPGSTPMSLAAAAAANIRREQEQRPEQVQGGDGGEEVPEWWFFPFLLLTAAYSPWSGQAPTEWRHLDSSDGPSKKRKGGDVTIDTDNAVCSPAVMSRLNPNGDALSRRQHFAAIKREKELEKKAAADKELQDARKEALDTKKKGLAALEVANTHVQAIGANMKRMVELKEAEAVGIKRENRIKALEKKMMLRLGNQEAIRAELERLLDEC